MINIQPDKGKKGKKGKLDKTNRVRTKGQKYVQVDRVKEQIPDISHEILQDVSLTLQVLKKNTTTRPFPHCKFNINSFYHLIPGSY